MAEAIEENIVPKHAKDSMRRLKDLAGVEEDALDSVLNLCNPFPDYAVKRLGWPSEKATGSVVIVDTYEKVITAPAGLVAGETWDLHAAMLPVPFTSVFSAEKFVETSGLVSTNTAGLSDASASLVIKTSSSAIGGDDPLDPLKAAVAVGARQVYSYGVHAEGSQHRVVAQGIELINTSAALYKGGAVYGYRIPADRTPIYWSHAVAAVPAGEYLGVSCMTGMPPRKPSDLVNYGNTFEGPAADGAYVINAPDDSRNEPTGTLGGAVVFSDGPGWTDGNVVLTQGSGSLNGWCFSGVMATGLAQNSSFLIRFRTYLEVFPLPHDGNSLIRLTNPTIASNPVINETLSVILRDMPAGCPYTHNPLGEWFESIMESVEAIAPMVGGIFGPIGGLVGSGVSHLAKGAKKMNKRARKGKPLLAPSKASGKKLLSHSSSKS